MLLWTAPAAADFQFTVEPGNSRSFKHWNSKKKKVTGYTSISCSVEKKTGHIIELSRNMDDNKEIFSEKKIWFSNDLNHLIRYEETDYRTDIKTLNTYQENSIHTEVWQKSDKLAFDIQIQPDLVPFEILPHYLQSRVPVIKQEIPLNFSLYLPAIATELKNKGLPLSWSKLDMKATVVKAQKLETILGLKETITIQIEATSFLINALLPKDKSRFRFTFLKQPPHHLIVFEEGDTETILESMD